MEENPKPTQLEVDHQYVYDAVTGVINAHKSLRGHDQAEGYTDEPRYSDVDLHNILLAASSLIRHPNPNYVEMLNGMTPENAKYSDCPFDYRLARTPYLVLPKLSIQVMPLQWRMAFDALLQQMEDTGLATPAYSVVVSGGEIKNMLQDDEEEACYGEIVPTVSIEDPWADYRHDQINKVKALCPDFKEPT
jgi:hypothetical protein